MEFAGLVVFVIVVATVIILSSKPRGSTASTAAQEQRYFYSRKDALMTAAEAVFFDRLQIIAGDRYCVFPQIHLSALLKNETKGKYWKAAFQRINRTSVDYVLAHKDTLRVAYVVELDDWSHDNNKRRARDSGVEAILAEAQIPLVRFRNASTMSNDEIAQKFYEAYKAEAIAD